MTGFVLSPETRWQRFIEPLPLDNGAVLPGFELAYRSWGRLSAERDNAVVVCHALTGTADADEWWGPLFGPGRALDPAHDYIVCSNALGGCYGSSGPASRAPDGRPWGARFPTVTVRDQVRAQMRLADSLGIRRIKLVIGGSMGGLQALEWAVLDSERVEAIASVAASARHSPWCIAWSEAQRMALAADPKYQDGHYEPDDPPVAGLAAARAMAMIGYRSPASLAQRFGRVGSDAGGDFAVAAWLRHHGDALVRRFDANSYRLLLDVLDSHDVAHGRGELAQVLGAVGQPALIVSIDSDALYVPEDQRHLADLLAQAEFVSIDSQFGHDGFLIDAKRLEPLVRSFRARLAKRAEDRRTGVNDVSLYSIAIADFAVCRRTNF